MCMKLPLENLNLSFYPSHSTNTYTYEVIIVPKVCGEKNTHSKLDINRSILNFLYQFFF